MNQRADVVADSLYRIRYLLASIMLLGPLAVSLTPWYVAILVGIIYVVVLLISLGARFLSTLGLTIDDVFGELREPSVPPSDV